MSCVNTLAIGVLLVCLSSLCTVHAQPAINSEDRAYVDAFVRCLYWDHFARLSADSNDRIMEINKLETWLGELSAQEDSRQYCMQQAREQYYLFQPRGAADQAESSATDESSQFAPSTVLRSLCPVCELPGSPATPSASKAIIRFYQPLDHCMIKNTNTEICTSPVAPSVLPHPCMPMARICHMLTSRLFECAC